MLPQVPQNTRTARIEECLGRSERISAFHHDAQKRLQKADRVPAMQVGGVYCMDPAIMLWPRVLNSFDVRGEFADSSMNTCKYFLGYLGEIFYYPHTPQRHT